MNQHTKKQKPNNFVSFTWSKGQMKLLHDVVCKPQMYVNSYTVDEMLQKKKKNRKGTTRVENFNLCTTTELLLVLNH